MLTRYAANLIRHGRIDPVEYYRCDRFRVVYVENAKVACTAIKQLLYPHLCHGHLEQDAFHEALRGHATRHPPPGTADYLYFTIVRDPAARLESCYHDKIRQAAAARDRGIFHSRAQRALFALFAGLDPTRAGVSLGDFANAVAMLPDRLRDRHVMSQATIVQAVRRADRHFVGRYERLATDWAALARLTGLPALPQLNSSAATRARDHGQPNHQAERAVARAYAADYRAFRDIPGSGDEKARPD